jgi:molybdate transport system substrate-binding protein
VVKHQAADSYNRSLEKDESTGGIAHVLVTGLVWQIGRGWEIGGAVGSRCRASVYVRGRPRFVCCRVALLVLALFGAACAHPPAHKLTVAAAADLNFALPEIARQFHAAAPAVELQIAYGSSGNFFAQIGNGAPFDVFFSADVAYPRKLAAAGVAPENSVFTYAVGRLVVWVPAASPLDPATALRDASVHRVAIANPRHAPYGRAAQAALRSLGLYQSVQPKLVLGENVAQALQFVESGAADTGIVALSLALAPPVRARGRYWEIPLDAYPRMDQGGIVLKDSPAARDFRAFLLSAAGRRILKQYGFFVPGE